MKKEDHIDSRNKELYESITKLYKVNFKKSSENYWGANINNGVVIIEHCKTNHPIASFTHELLHIDTQIKGYKRVRTAISLNKDTNTHLPRLLGCIDNEFQHHKMYMKFEEMGFPPNEFFDDADSKETEKYLENVIKISGKPFIVLAVDYMTLIAPGGSILPNKLKEIQDAFYNYDAGKYCVNFQEIDKIIADWKGDLSYDVERYIIRFFKNIEAGQTWISYAELPKGVSKTEFPNTGFFTDKSFTFEDLDLAFQ